MCAFLFMELNKLNLGFRIKNMGRIIFIARLFLVVFVCGSAEAVEGDKDHISHGSNEEMMALYHDRSFEVVASYTLILDAPEHEVRATLEEHAELKKSTV